MPAAIAIPLITAAATAGSSVAAAKMQSSAAKKAAALQAQSAASAQAAQTSATDQALQFQKDQAALDNARQETNRRADYDQWAARENRISTLGQALGLGARQIPGYVPGPMSGQTPGTIAGTAGASGGDRLSAAASVDGSPASLDAFFKSQGVANSETPYWAGKWQELVARGKELNDPQYAAKRLAAAEVFGGGGGQSMPKGIQTAGTIGAPLTPAYVAPKIQLPGTISGYAS
jgi:type II secretory pathway pseudopilin PulG